jgi:1-deoxy-D-xylulose-5-phosphate synthase
MEALAEAGVVVPLRALAVPDRFIEQGDTATQLHELGLDSAGIAAAARELVAARPRTGS